MFSVEGIPRQDIDEHKIFVLGFVHLFEVVTANTLHSVSPSLRKWLPHYLTVMV